MEEEEKEGETAKILWWHTGRSRAVNKHITASQHSGGRRKRIAGGGGWRRRRRSKQTWRGEGRGVQEIHGERSRKKAEDVG